MCKNFILNNFNKNIVKAYDLLIPSAYKCDLWRFCILYKFGGIYGDLTQLFLKKFNVNKYNSDIVLIKDRPNNSIQINFIATIKNNNFLKYVINKTSKQILEMKKGNSPLDITGPIAFGKHFLSFFKKKKIKIGRHKYIGLDNKKYRIWIPFKLTGDFLVDKNNNKFVKTKIKDHKKLLYKNKLNYDLLWKKNIIFNKLKA